MGLFVGELAAPPGGVFLLRLESTAVVCFLGVTAIPVSGVLRLESWRLVATIDRLVIGLTDSKGVGGRDAEPVAADTDCVPRRIAIVGIGLKAWTGSWARFVIRKRLRVARSG